jgi:hypothetical protein
LRLGIDMRDEVADEMPGEALLSASTVHLGIARVARRDFWCRDGLSAILTTQLRSAHHALGSQTRRQAAKALTPA